jgi:hypothetical protein
MFLRNVSELLSDYTALLFVVTAVSVPNPTINLIIWTVLSYDFLGYDNTL